MLLESLITLLETFQTVLASLMMIVIYDRRVFIAQATGGTWHSPILLAKMDGLPKIGSALRVWTW
jgi:hypothetical protein